jgi:pimeloyl-ACP methyl ester carboxylesterase
MDRDTAAPYQKQLEQFQKTHRLGVIYSKGIEWTYLVGGAGDETILALHGGGGPAESLFRYIMAFEESFRVVAPTIPAGVSTVADALQGIRAVLEAAFIRCAHVFGVSNGERSGSAWFASIRR